ncbi:OLC1v1038541C1 [Oldenlandia corymbosa var. corymbosa]|uniref:OLC1v1038541C1 n=1 Tax=Oldenlandia corymbosa var. corymbosa TaxID=529605 RepID=A0AAV1D2R5_OLDCO|nr:OLC1v1038541C1 [Oldenlandia corymbosa var. corymbosa]
MAIVGKLLVMSLCMILWKLSFGIDPQDASVLRSLKDQWANTPRGWNVSVDPCSWEGVLCSARLSGMNISGNLDDSIAQLTELRTLDLSSTRLTGSIPRGLGDLPMLENLFLDGCGFSGEIPDELGNLVKLCMLDLSSNNLSGEIPPSLGTLQTLKILRLDTNAFSGELPNLNSLKNLRGISIRNNFFSGSLPDLTGNDRLEYLDLSSNSFQPSHAPAWLSTLNSLSFLGSCLHNFSLYLNSKCCKSKLLYLKNNAFNGTLEMSGNISRYLQRIDLRNNGISSVDLSSGYDRTLLLMGNPICQTSPNDEDYC